MLGTRTPTNIIKLRGGDKRHPERMRERENEPKDDREIRPAPPWLSEDERGCYEYLVSLAIPGVLKACDEPAVASAAKLLMIIYSGQAKVTHYAQFTKLLSQFGMMPADRSKINLQKPPEKNEFDDD